MVKDWDTATIGDILDFKNGLNKGKDYFGQGTPIVNYTDVYKHRGLKRGDIKGLVSLERSEIKRYKVKKGDVFFTRTSETPEEVGIASVLLDDITNCVFSGFILRGRPKNDMLVPEYCKYCFSTPYVRQEIISNCTYTTRALTNGKQLSRIEIPVPEKEEQYRIAQALSDMDDLICSLENLIVKKKYVREGAMQELLTQKKEFPFMDNSEVDYRIGDIGDFYSGLTGKSKDDFGTGNAKYITFLNVLSNSIIDISILERANIEDGESQNAARLGDLFFNTSSETPEEVGMCAVLLDDVRNVYLNSFCFGYRIKSKDIDPLFFSYYFNSQEGRKIMSVLAQGATRYNLSKSYFADTIVSFPKYEKQKLIAQILHDMDTEIKSLQSKLEKYRQMKSGMMDALLTGKVRLV